MESNEEVISDFEWKFSLMNGENPFEKSAMKRETFADAVLNIMRNRDFEPAEKASEIDALLTRVMREAATNLLQEGGDEVQQFRIRGLL